MKHGASLVTGSRRENSSSLAPPSETQASSAAATSGNSRFSRFSVRSLLGARPGNARSVDFEALQWEVSRRRFGADSVGSAKGVASGSVSARSAGRGDGVEVAGGAERASTFDVSSNCVTPVFRVSPYLQKISDLENKKVRVLFVSEGNVCRSVYAEAIFNSLIEENGMREFVECASKGSRDYNVDESPDPRAVAVAEEMGVKLPEGAVARVFNCQADIVLFDLLVVMDKFNASDVLKEVTVYEAIDKEARYTHKVRRLGEFCRTKKMEDIDDPLYGNMGGPEELVLLRESYDDIRASCEGLMQTIMEIQAGLQDSETLKQGVGRSLGEMKSLDWLVPPMLQKAETIFN